MKQFISVPLFIASLCIGIFVVYITEPNMHVVYVYPTPNNVNKIQYKDKLGNCFRFKQTKVQCPKNNKIQSYAPQI